MPKYFTEDEFKIKVIRGQNIYIIKIWEGEKGRKEEEDKIKK